MLLTRGKFVNVVGFYLSYLKCSLLCVFWKRDVSFANGGLARLHATRGALGVMIFPRHLTRRGATQPLTRLNRIGWENNRIEQTTEQWTNRSSWNRENFSGRKHALTIPRLIACKHASAGKLWPQLEGKRTKWLREWSSFSSPCPCV